MTEMRKRRAIYMRIMELRNEGLTSDRIAVILSNEKFEIRGASDWNRPRVDNFVMRFKNALKREGMRAPFKRNKPQVTHAPATITKSKDWQALASLVLGTDLDQEAKRRIIQTLVS